MIPFRSLANTSYLWEWCLSCGTVVFCSWMFCWPLTPNMCHACEISSFRMDLRIAKQWGVCDTLDYSQSQVKQLLSHRCLLEPWVQGIFLCQELSTDVYTIPPFSVDFTWSPFSKCSIQSLPSSVSPALWWWSLKLRPVPFSVRKPQQMLSSQQDPESSCVSETQGAGAQCQTHGWGWRVHRAFFAQVTGSGCLSSGCSHRSPSWDGGGHLLRLFLHQILLIPELPHFDFRLISKPTWVLSYCISSSESSTWHRCNAHYLLGLRKKTHEDSRNYRVKGQKEFLWAQISLTAVTCEILLRLCQCVVWLPKSLQAVEVIFLSKSILGRCKTRISERAGIFSTL